MTGTHEVQPCFQYAFGATGPFFSSRKLIVTINEWDGIRLAWQQLSKNSLEVLMTSAVSFMLDKCSLNKLWLGI